MALEIRSIKRKTPPETIPENNQGTMSSPNTASTPQEKLVSKKEKKNNKTVTSSSKLTTESQQTLPAQTTSKKTDSSSPSEAPSSQTTAKSQKSTRKSPAQAVVSPETPQVEPQSLSASQSFQAILSTPFFQAIGFIQGVIIPADNGQVAIQIGSTVYKLYAHPQLRKKLKIGKEFVLRVYPAITNQKQVFGFYVLSRCTDSPDQKIKLEDAIPNLFILKGIWQLYSKSKNPVISIFRNRQRHPKDLCKPTHVPLLWENPPVPPFYFNPNLTPGEKKPRRYFVAIQAKFLPEQRRFVFDSLLTKPSRKIPKYLKEIKPL
ncbi:MAG: hypothetical protein VKL42_10005 [Snowella sp.]|nr:hypothetical protein [Snowella sp.]